MLAVSKFLTGLWNKIKRDSSSPTLNISEDDIVVFVVGPTGSGKSWFTKAATKSDLVKVSRNQRPCTGKVQAIRCDLTDEAKRDLQGLGVKSVVFVDTPSFLTECDGLDAQSEFTTWFGKVLVYEPRYVGVIYMHRVETDPAREPIKAHLQEFSNIPQIRDVRLPQRLHIVTSYDKTSGTLPESKITERTSSLRAQVDSLRQSTGRWKPSMHGELFQGETEVTCRAVEELFRN